jgi:hypothetical protein
MTFPRRRQSSARWPLLGAAVLAASAAAVTWMLFLRKESNALSDEDLREIEAFEEYERRKREKA